MLQRCNPSWTMLKPAKQHHQQQQQQQQQTTTNNNKRQDYISCKFALIRPS